jgi:hypothetical protein
MGNYSNSPLYPLLRSPDNSEIIGRLAKDGWQAVSAILPMAGLYETVGAVVTRTAVAGLSGAARFSIYTLPITAFLLGASIRQRMDDRDEQLKQSVWLIIRIAWSEALAKHAKIFPDSKIIDTSQTLGIIHSGDEKYKAAYTVLGSVQTSARSRMMGEAQVASMPVGLSTVYDGKLVSPWEAFVLSNFNDLVVRDSQAFLLLEAASRK